MVLLSNGAMVVVGMQSSSSTTTDSRALIAKFTNNGQLDSSFNTGFLALDLDNSVTDNSDQLYDIAVDSAGVLYASGSSVSSTTDWQTVLSISPTGSLNSQFDGDGIGLYDFGTSSDSPTLTLDANQKPLLTGLTSNTTDGGTDIFIARLASDGQVDPLFNNGNAYITSYGFADDVSLIINISSNALLITGNFPASQLNATAWYMHKLTLVEN